MRKRGVVHILLLTNEIYRDNNSNQICLQSFGTIM
ncbi:MAG: hypothetical protein AWU58_312 [Methanohalophilus sp. T328-1]|nr:MAG: hypothetical protein AWU58_312 [Methanohalophilus sp. T328-1]